MGWEGGKEGQFSGSTLTNGSMELGGAQGSTDS